MIYIGSFSKTLFPALRLGYMVVPATLREAFGAAKLLSDFGSPAIEQAALARFIASGAFDRHLRQAAKTLKERRALLLAGLRAAAGDRVEVADSHAGMHLVAWLRDLGHAQCEALLERALECGLGLQSLAPHCLKPTPRPGLLLGYAGISAADLPEAMRLFGRCLDEFPPTG